MFTCDNSAKLLKIETVLMQVLLQFIQQILGVFFGHSSIFDSGDLIFVTLIGKKVLKLSDVPQNYACENLEPSNALMSL